MSNLPRVSNRHQYKDHSEILDKAMEDMNNAECDNFDSVAANEEHIDQQDCTVEDKPSEPFLTPAKTSSIATMICHYDLLDDMILTRQLILM